MPADLHEGGAEVAGGLVTRPRDVAGLHPARRLRHRGGGLGPRQGGPHHEQHQQHGLKCCGSRENRSNKSEKCYFVGNVLYHFNTADNR